MLGCRRPLAQTHRALSPLCLAARVEYQGEITRASVATHLLHRVHRAAVQLETAQLGTYTSVLVPVSATPYAQRRGLGNYSSSHLSVARCGLPLASAARFLESCNVGRGPALRRLSWYGRLPSVARMLLGAIARFSGWPHESAILSVIDITVLGPSLRRGDLVFQVPIRDEKSLGFGVVKDTDGFVLTVYGKACRSELLLVLERVLAPIQYTLIGEFRDVQ